jgi:type III restriction enzyme
LLEIFKRSGNKEAATRNPQEFATAAVRIIKHKLAEHLVNGIQYEKINQWYEMTQLEAEIESWKDYLIPAGHSVYDHVLVDSQTEDPRASIEGKFVEALEKRDDVKLYLKLPSWFTVDTPVGTYNPDWAIVMEDRNAHGQPTGTHLYLVRETKGENWKTDLRPDERRKIECGQRHFKGALGVDFKVVSDARRI